MQQSIPVPEPQGPGGPCRWCGMPSVGTVEVEKARYTTHLGVRVVKRAALLVPACARHIDIVARQAPEHDDTA